MPKRTKSLRQLLVDLSTKTMQADRANLLAGKAATSVHAGLQEAVAQAVAAIEEVVAFPYRCLRHSYRLSPLHHSVDIVLETLAQKSDGAYLRTECFWSSQAIPGYDEVQRAVVARLQLPAPWKAGVRISGNYFEESK